MNCISHRENFAVANKSSAVAWVRRWPNRVLSACAVTRRRRLERRGRSDEPCWGVSLSLSWPAKRGASPESSRQPAGFTLIELLVVMGVVAILVAILFPVLGQSKAAGRQAQCVSNLHQLGLAAEMYWDDNDGGTFRYRGAFTNGGDLFWFGWLQRGGESAREFDATQGVLYSYLQGRGIEICPSLRYDSAHFKYKAREAAYGYGVNLHLTAPELDSINEVARPADTIAFADSAQVNTFQAPASPSNPMLEEFYYVSRTERTAHFRHRGMANAAFCDGHVDHQIPDAGSIDPQLPSERVGRLTTSSLATH